MPEENFVEMSQTSTVSDLRRLRDRLRATLKDHKRRNARLEESALRAWTRKAREGGSSQLLLPFLIHKSSSTLPNEVQRRCLQLSQDLNNWRCKELKNSVKYVSGTSGLITTEWRAAYSLPAYPDAVLTFKFDSTDDDTSGTEIENLHIAFSDSRRDDEQIIIVDHEVQSLLEYCVKFGDFQAAFKGLENYLKTSGMRSSKLKKEAYVESGDKGVTVTFKNDTGRDLCQLNWWLEFDWSEMAFAQGYKVEFTDAGFKSAKECSFPSELSETGQCQDWKPEYCAQNLARMAALDVSTPAKKPKLTRMTEQIGGLGAPATDARKTTGARRRRNN